MVTILTLVIKLMVLLLACPVIERVLLESAAVYVNDIPISIYILYKYIQIHYCIQCSCWFHIA